MVRLTRGNMSFSRDTDWLRGRLERSSRLWNTVRWLRPAQFWGRMWSRFYRPRPNLDKPPATREASGTWHPCARRASMSAPTTFRFLNVEHRLCSADDWTRSSLPALWLYNLHYFDDLVAENADDRTDWHRALMARWMSDNPPGRAVAWDPYPTSLRIVNWIKWSLSGRGLDDDLRHSLAVQIRWLRNRLEIHLLGNHLWANAKALIFAGTFFQGEEADQWLAKGMNIVRRELSEQILGDGGHFERSPMYHCILLEDLLDLLQLAWLFPRSLPENDVMAWQSTARRMFCWLRAMTHPDGDIGFFNDTSLGIAPNLNDLEAYAKALSLTLDRRPLASIEALPDSGYVRLDRGKIVLIADVGQIGPDYLPAHAHADTLSFELSLAGKRVFVNSGVSTYEVGAQRLHQRGTASKNALQVNGEDSSEVWSSFRVARRARPHDVMWGQDGETLYIRASHDGYKRLGLPSTMRHWRLEEQHLYVADRIVGKPANAVVRFHLHPAVEAALHEDRVDLYWNAQKVASMHFGGAKTCRLVDSCWYPEFGKTVANRCVEVLLAGSTMETRLDLESSN